ncbi:P-loop containing nucleoside triphosphate hydrolase protein [Ochromonadaceae sp. CCMP2298]|nr:P-loop containing nucleoside triphosphate hydrolase protein [Ochromonadaceae sp. CCMP2298]
MLRSTFRKLPYLRSPVASAGRSVRFISADADAPSSVKHVDPVQAYVKEHQITLKGATVQEFQPMLSFDESSPFAPKLKSVLQREGFTAPSPIQAVSWPIAISGKDIISVARTGSGKTLGFLLPAFQRIVSANSSQKAPSKTNFATGRSRSSYRAPTVLVLAPTRELTEQIATEAQKYAVAGVDIATAYGGTAKGPQIFKLRKGVDVVVATPGRCNDLAEMGALDLSKIEYLVLDEADRMLDMGFMPQIREIADQLPSSEQRQTLFFTATWPKEVQALASEFLRDPVQISIGDQNSLNANKAIKQVVSVVKEFDKEKALFDLLGNTINLTQNPQSLPKTIIFVGRKTRAEELYYELRRAGYHVASLHGDKSQAARSDVMDKFRRGRISLLVATDVAARGLDVKDGKAMKELVGVMNRCAQEVPAELEVSTEYTVYTKQYAVYSIHGACACCPGIPSPASFPQ